MNELRNRVAHDLDAVLDEEAAVRLERALALRPEKTMGLIYRPPDRDGSPRERIGWAIMSLWTDAVEQITRRQPPEEEPGEWQ